MTMIWHGIAVQTVQDHVRNSIHFLGIMDKTFKITWSPASHMHPKILLASWGLIITSIYRYHLGIRKFSYIITSPLKHTHTLQDVYCYLPSNTRK